MMNGAKKGQKPKKPIKQKPVKALTGLEIALIGGAAGLAGSALMGGGKKAAATPLNNPAALIAPLSGFVGKEEDKEKAPGMKMGGLSGGKRYGAPPKKGPMSRGMKDGGAVAGAVAGAVGEGASRERVAIQRITPKQRREENIRIRNSKTPKTALKSPMKSPMEEGMMGGDAMGMKKGGMTYNDKMGMEGGSSMGQKDIQVKKKVFKGIF